MGGGGVAEDLSTSAPNIRSKGGEEVRGEEEDEVELFLLSLFHNCIQLFQGTNNKTTKKEK